jgi:hypothetical protein
LDINADGDGLNPDTASFTQLALVAALLELQNLL